MPPPLQEAVQIHPQNLPYLALNQGLRQARKLADPPSRAPQVSQPLLSIGRFTLSTSLRARLHSEENSAGAASSAATCWKPGLRLHRDSLMIVLVLEF